MEEARVSFVNGQFMASILSATAVVEHLLVDELESRSIPVGDKGPFGVTIQRAKKAQPRPFTVSLLDDADRLRELRNPLVHRKADVGEHSLVEKYQKRKVHP